jgi:hypothetical protein
VTPELVSVLGQIYVHRVQVWRTFLEVGGDDEGGALESVGSSLQCVKILRRLLISGFERPHTQKDVQEFWSLVQNHFGDFLRIVTETQQILAEDVRELVEKHLIQFSKLHNDMAKTHPASFALMPNTLELVQAYWGLVLRLGETFGSRSAETGHKLWSGGDADDNEEEKPLDERLGLKGLLLLRSCVKMVWNPAQTFKYKTPEMKEEQANAREFVKVQLLTDSFVCQVMEVIVTKFFVFRARDLQEWEAEPDEWEIREEGGGDSWEFSIRPCSEKLFLDLVLNYKEMLIQPLLNVFYSVASKLCSLYPLKSDAG